jgi:hypothetical protein
MLYGEQQQVRPETNRDGALQSMAERGPECAGDLRDGAEVPEHRRQLAGLGRVTRSGHVNADGFSFSVPIRLLLSLDRHYQNDRKRERCSHIQSGPIHLAPPFRTWLRPGWSKRLCED